MFKPDWRLMGVPLRRGLAAAPMVAAGLGLAMAASSTPRPAFDLTAEEIALATGGDLSAHGLAALQGRLDPAQLALAIRHDPAGPTPGLQGLTPGWESLTLGGKPGLEPGAVGLEARRLNAAAPAASNALRPARPFVLAAASTEDRVRARRCLTQAIYYEAALESEAGQAAVAQVVLNRVRDPNYPDSVCGVVFQGAERVTGCQFSFTCDGALARPPVAWAWERAAAVADRALAGHVAQAVGTATHYHADYVRPWWAPTLAKVTQIGTHIFYRWKGLHGETAAFRQAYAGREPTIDEARFARPRLVLAAEPATPEAAEAALLDAAATGRAVARTVEIDGRQRIVGVVSLGGRRQPTREEIAAINQNLAAFEAPPAPASAPSPPPPGVTAMEVEEVGRPAR